ncbi:cytochrome P450 [Podospora aff. communis PSN243]|uniref:Cytochrome P450 n=1 Tax=Podospora aff. communis PSN243 TaxID=3040156 RepID=A0AAV9GIK8_9PEZI|nr:cytochrome P450 [Podospora aff. communis PSN243]
MQTLSIVITTLLLLIIHHLLTYLRSPTRHLPGPWYTALTSLPLEYHRLTGNVTHWTHALSLRYGPVVRLSPARVAINHTSAWEEIHRIGAGFRKTKFHESIVIGPEQMLFGIRDVKKHKERRKLFARALGMGVLRENWEYKVREKAELAVRRIREEAEKGRADVVKWWRLMAGDVIAFLSFGESFDLLEDAEGDNEEDKGDEYFKALDNAGVNILLDSLFPKFLLRGLGRVWKGLGKIVFANDVITERGAVAVKNLREVGQGRPNLFSNMLAEADKAESVWLTDDAVRSEAAGFLLAGSDTTGMALTYMVWAVLRRPDLQRRMEAEVATLSPDFTDKDVEKLSLLNNVLDEVLRLYNPGSGNIIRDVPESGVTFHGHFIPSGVVISTQQWTMVRDDSLFPNAEEFDETRFEHATDKQRRVAQPFGIGTRSCIGIHLAKMELRLATALFFRECRGIKISKNMTEDMMIQRMKFFTYPKGNRCDITLVESLAQG